MDTLVTARSAGSVSTWHAMTADAVVKQLATTTELGLDPGEAAIRMQKYGPNRLPEGKKRGAFNRLLSQFNNVLVYVLLGAGFTKLMLSLWIDAAIILGVVILNGLLGFIQEGRAEKALELDPQYAVCGSSDHTWRRDTPDSSGTACARRLGTAGIGRQGTGRSAADRRQ